MRIIVGLGNPGKEYENTRHNVGYMFVDQLTSCREITSVGQKLNFAKEKKFEAEIAETLADGEKILLVKPLTFMNSSGVAVEKILSFYKAESKDLIVISDDIDLPIGIMRVRKEGGSGGHKGLQNIIDIIGSDNFLRIRIGISEQGEKVTKDDTVNFVLDSFSKREQPIIDRVINQGTELIADHFQSRKEIPCHTYHVVAGELEE